MSDIEQRLSHLSPAKRELLRHLAARQRVEKGRIQARPRPARIPLTFGQRRLWLVDQLSPGTAAYNEPVGLWIEGPLQRDRLRAAVQSLADRHESLRTVVAMQDGEVLQRIRDSIEVPWRDAAVDGAAIEDRRSAALAIATEEIRRPFNLSSDAMMRALLVDVAPGLALLLLTFHHIAVDGWAATSLLSDLRDAYAEQLAGGCFTDRPQPLQIADYALWQESTLGGDGLRAQLDYWTNQLAGAPAVLDLPTDRARPVAQSFQGAQWHSAIPAGLGRRVEAFAGEQGATASMIWLAAWQAVLARYTGQDDIVVGMGVAGRNRPELESVVGFFVNTLPLRTRIDMDSGFSALVSRVRDGVLGAMDNADAPLDRVLDALRIPRPSGFTPFAQAMFFFQSYPSSTACLAGLRVEKIAGSVLQTGTSKGDLTLFVEQGEMIIEYATALFVPDRIERLGGHLLTFLHAALGSPETSVSKLALLTPVERRQLERWNSTTKALPADPTIAALFDAQVQRTPEGAALRFGSRVMSYRELDRRAHELAAQLRARGVGPGVLVGLYVDRTPEMLIGLIGIAKAGGAYVPMDPAYPRDRLDYMLEVCRARVLVSHGGLHPAFGDSVEVLLADADAALGERAPLSTKGARPCDPAYVIFTSGSTGRPKGVEIQQRSAVNLLRSVAREPGVAAGDLICAISTLSFDIALFELVLPLTVGATVLLVDRDTARDGLRLRRLVESEPISVMQATPATWRMLLDVGWTGGPSLKIISTGEALPRELAQRLRPCGRELWNLYGPTETTVYSALCRVECGEGPVLVGRPVDNTLIHIVDRHFQPVPVGVPGELLIGGGGLATAYRGRPDLTAEKFVPDSLGTTAGGRLYRTGDLALRQPDGSIEVIGRIDHQIKLRGFRIELGEIESVLLSQPGVAQAVVICREDQPGDRRLVAYVTFEGKPPEIRAMRDCLNAALPDYMVPSAFVVLHAFPLTPNGKVDHSALPVPEGTGNDREVIIPRTPEERELLAYWQDLLGVERIDMRDNFFELGGHSLLATRLLSRIAHSFGTELSLRTLFDAPTLEQLAARVAIDRDRMRLDDIDGLLASLEGISDAEASRLTASGGLE